MSTSFQGFPRDILVFDFESTGFERDDRGDLIEIGDPISLGAVLLDRTTLAETGDFYSLIRPARKVIPQALAIHHLTDEMLQAAPEPKAVAEQFWASFDVSDIWLSGWNCHMDGLWLDRLLAPISRSQQSYDYHQLDIWVMAQTYLAQLGQAGHMSSEATFKAFGQASRQEHNALDDCRRTAEVLRAIINKQEPQL